MRKSNKIHPCFNEKCGGVRMHLPVAPQCNIQCGYCNRKMDCPNECRPGVTSEIITPCQAKLKFEKMKQEMNIDVVGIAGPGDPLANFEKTIETLRLIREIDGNVKLCISTNGLLLSKYLMELVESNVNYFTVTINSLDEEVSRNIYEFVEYEGLIYKDRQAAMMLKSKQIEALEMMASLGLYVKINTVYIEGINDKQMVRIAKMAKYYKCKLLNIIPMIKVSGTLLFDSQDINYDNYNNAMNEVKQIIPIMNHCAHCRADAIGYVNC